MSKTANATTKHPLSEDERVALSVELALQSRARHAWESAQARFARMTTAIRSAAHKRLEIRAGVSSEFLLDKSTGAPFALKVTEAVAAPPAQVTAPEISPAPV